MQELIEDMKTRFFLHPMRWGGKWTKCWDAVHLTKRVQEIHLDLDGKEILLLKEIGGRGSYGVMFQKTSEGTTYLLGFVYVGEGLFLPHIPPEVIFAFQIEPPKFREEEYGGRVEILSFLNRSVHPMWYIGWLKEGEIVEGEEEIVLLEDSLANARLILSPREHVITPAVQGLIYHPPGVYHLTPVVVE